jgi:hypothetical protein
MIVNGKPAGAFIKSNYHELNPSREGKLALWGLLNSRPSFVSGYQGIASEGLMVVDELESGYRVESPVSLVSGCSSNAIWSIKELQDPHLSRKYIFVKKEEMTKTKTVQETKTVQPTGFLKSLKKPQIWTKDVEQIVNISLNQLLEKGGDVPAHLLHFVTAVGHDYAGRVGCVIYTLVSDGETISDVALEAEDIGWAQKGKELFSELSSKTNLALKELGIIKDDKYGIFPENLAVKTSGID